MIAGLIFFGLLFFMLALALWAANGGHRHVWYRGDHWNERECRECGEVQTMYCREWITTKQPHPKDSGQ